MGSSAVSSFGARRRRRTGRAPQPSVLRYCRTFVKWPAAISDASVPLRAYAKLRQSACDGRSTEMAESDQYRGAAGGQRPQV